MADHEVTCRHVPANPDVMQTVCVTCGAEMDLRPIHPRTTPTRKEYKALQIATFGMFSMYLGQATLMAEGYWKSEHTLTDREIARSGAEIYDRLVEATS